MATTKVRKKDTGEAGNKGEFGTVHRGEADVQVAPPVDQYTFLARFEELDRKYEQDFEGFPTRFFSADLRGKYLPPAGSPKEDRFFRANYSTAIPQRLYQAVSDTSDLKVSDDDAIALAQQCGIEDVEPIDPQYAKALKLGQRAWVGTRDGVQIAFSDASAGTKNAREYRFRKSPKKPFTATAFVHLDLRALAANERIKRKTGIDLLPAVTKSEIKRLRAEGNRALMHEGDPALFHSNAELAKGVTEHYVDDVRSATLQLEDAQVEGRNFQAQRKYMRDKASSIATAWQDKKHPDREHASLAESTSLAGHFAKVEIDNDVDRESYLRFEQAWEDTRAKLPPIPKGREPVLRIRKLGKHRAAGVFFPHANTIAIDVHDSGSFIHEYGHYVDIVTKDNASLGKEFRGIVDTYSRRLEVPSGQTGKHGAAYFTTPTEVYARGFELYAHERLGVDNRLLNPDKHGNFDFAPFRDDPSMKERMFELFDKAFAR